MEKLSKSQFMAKYTNDFYNKRLAKKEIACGANAHIAQNVSNIKKEQCRRRV